MGSQEIRLFSSDESVHAIKSPVKMEILNLLDRGDCSFDTVVAATGKAKSTVSAHIKDLEQMKLLFSHPDPDDLRKRIISKNAVLIGTLTSQGRNLQSRLKVPNDMEELRTPDFYRILLLTLKTEALALGINVDPVFRRVGNQIGTHLAPLLVQDSLEETLSSMAAFWKQHSLGTLSVKCAYPLTIEVIDCIECSQYPITGKKECHFAMGLLKAIFSHYYQMDVIVTEQACYATGDEKCMFEIIVPPQ